MQSFLPGAMLIMLCATASAADGQVVTHTTATQEAFAACLRDRYVDVTAAGAAKLAPIDYVVHDVGNRIARVQGGGGRLARKLFVLETLGAASAELYVFGRAGKAKFNGTPITFRATEHGGWVAARVAGRRLRPGENELVFSDDFRLAMDLDRSPPKFSFLGREGGTTSAPARGEFLVHLRLHRHPARGVIRSNVIDLADTEDTDKVRPLIQVSRVAVSHDAALPDGTAIDLEARTGHSPRLDDAETWTDWGPVSALEPRQYVQWRATLSTSDRRRSPVLRGVTVEADVESQADTEAIGLRVVACDSPRIVRSSFPFTHQPPSPRLAELRRRWKLDEVVAPGRTEMERLILLRNWVRRQWPHNDNGAGERTWDAIEILSAPPDRRGMCVHYAVAFTQCALSLGYNARQVILYHHYVAEVWSNEHRKWVLMDVETPHREGWDRHGTALYVDRRTNTPMSALDLHRAVASGRTTHIVQKFYMTDPDGNHELHERSYGASKYGPYLRFAYPMRNNYLDQLKPWEEYHGFGDYRSDAYLWWKDDARGNTPEYSWQTSREGDVSWTLNQARLFAYCTAQSDVLKLRFDTSMPNLKHLAYRANGSDWQTLEGMDFEWRLASGQNRFEIKPVNELGMQGITSLLVVER